MEILLVLAATCAALWLITKARKAQPMVVEAEELPIDEVQAKEDASYATEAAREDAERRKWYASLYRLEIGILKGWSLSIDYRSSDRPKRFRPIRLDSIRYDETGFYLLGDCLRSGDFRHFSLELIHAYADADTRQEFASFDLWAAHQGVEVNLAAQIDAATLQIFGQD
ncbi:hypothetical protein [Rhizorhabdus sp.]|uniref:hypothetical protein n=1 Tax=Rhizorhabdus sp. TaxID=1968843 RepID=UPI0019BEA839|nr:hypothetical protein [Rhizorhabdus sp.]MBD3762436.1 hypothetical protein [Rhizorhabdus sp.]